ncbi:MAG: DUF2344 domain-containing protein [Eubacterium sp.]|nr:DUF2344 domain-containing protein [Eubacterium sp.]
MKIRIEFSKTGVLKFIGHLDIMRYFQKAIRRSGIDIAYTEGFSPHQVMSFAAPLGVGLESESEYLDIEVRRTQNSRVSMEKLNAAMADGIRILSYRVLPENAKNAMSVVAAASYRVMYKQKEANPFTLNGLEEKIRQYITSCPVILITKKTKKSERQINLKESIYECKTVDTPTGAGFEMLVAAGSTENIKPELVLSYFYEKSGFEYPKYDLQIIRTGVYYREESDVFFGQADGASGTTGSASRQGYRFSPLRKAGEDIV